ncbi:thioredoxin domain-containing protein [Winogradskyella flava]|uniref:thioredoxin domain-containing protein n=1 Tax=Winogradskyella flava TaxID=1884876 RepID=UPI0024928F30|nr:thioredoxin domain-containing protein [Winogradskyella flava]
MTNKAVYYITLMIFLLGCSQSNTSISASEGKKSNALINETSPYLLQHAYNPVDWKAWNDDALQLAKDQNKLIVISVGYSACHWCHVMEEESFENDSVAKLMNDNFINIKVDREERPDIDQIYMNAVQLMTGSGGWPLNCITLPDGRPVFGGTYFTKAQWTKILKDMSSLYQKDPKKVISFAEKLTEGVRNSDLITVKKELVDFDTELLGVAVKEFTKSLDFKDGGQKGSPKFPSSSHLDFLLRYSFQTNNDQLKDYVVTTLTKMANGGIYDQIGGGFSRYSVDDKWHIPHFEKMLYDNAQLVSLYSKAYQLTKNIYFKEIVEETLSFVDSEFLTKEGAFFSSLDADSENSQGELEEGVYYTWTQDELQSLLGDDFELFKDYYNINAKGKWENDLYVLYRTTNDSIFTEAHDLSFENFDAKKESWKQKLKAVRYKRHKPKLDDKVLTSWNALMLKAYIDAFNAIGSKAYLKKATDNANFIINNQLSSDGALYHSYKNGKSTIDGFSEDYAHVISAFIELYQTTLNEKWLDTSKVLLDYTIENFLNKESSMFYFTSDSSTNLITRKTEVYDNVIPSSNSVLADNLFKLGHYYSDKTYLKLGNQMLKNVNDEMLEIPSVYTNWMSLYLNYSNPYYEVAISGKDANTKLKALKTYYIPNILISGATTESTLPLLKNKFIEDQTLIYVCVNGTCKLPVDSVNKALSQILK